MCFGWVYKYCFNIRSYDPNNSSDIESRYLFKILQYHTKIKTSRGKKYCVQNLESYGSLIRNNISLHCFKLNITSRMNCLNFGTLILAFEYNMGSSGSGWLAAAADLWILRHWTLESGCWSKTCSLLERGWVDGNIIGTKSNLYTILK